MTVNWDHVLKFIAVGGTATVIHFAVLVSLVEMLGWHPTLATTIGYLTSAGFNYGANRALTFRSAAEHRSALPKFAAMCVAGASLNAGLMWLFVQLGSHYIVAQLAATVAVLVFNFTVASRWVFPSAASVAMRADQ